MFRELHSFCLAFVLSFNDKFEFVLDYAYHASQYFFFLLCLMQLDLVVNLSIRTCFTFSITQGTHASKLFRLFFCVLAKLEIGNFRRRED